MFKFFSHVSAKRLMRNFAANVVGQVMNGVYQIVAIPLFLHYWSKEGYGEWLVLYSIPGVLWSMEGGLSGVAANRMTVASAAGDWELANTLFQNVFFAQGLLTLVLLAAAGILVSTVDLQSYFHFSQIGGSQTSAILLLLLAYMLTGFYISLFRAAYRSAAMEHRGIMANNFWRLTDFGLTVVTLICHGSAEVLALAILFGAVIWALLLYFDVSRVCDRIEFGIRRASWKQSRGIMVDGMPLLAGQAATALFLQGYPFIINRMLGASAVVTFVTVRTVSRTILLLNQVICLSSAPEVSRSYGQKDWPTYVRLLKIMLASALFAGAVTLTGLTIWGPWVIKLWTSGKIIIGHETLFLFALSIALQGIYGVSGIVLVCSNMHHLYNYLCLVVALAALALAGILLPYFGFISVPATMVVQDLTLALLALALCRSKLNHISWGDFRFLLTPRFYWAKVNSLFNRA